MAYREVAMVEIKEVLRQWLDGVAKKRIAARLGTDPKTVRRYTKAAEGAGLRAGGGSAGLTEELLARIALELKGRPEREHGEAWGRCEEQRAFIESSLSRQVRLKKIWRLLKRQGVMVPYSTMHRYAVEVLGFGRTAATVPVADGKPGEELHTDTGWVHRLEPDENGRRRRLKAWIFTPHVSRYRFVYPCLEETTAGAIEACEAAWEFYGGVFSVLVSDNTKAIINKADPLEPKCVLGFLEYAQARGFHVDPTRVRSPKDKARVERSVRDTRDDCFAGEQLLSLANSRAHARRWYQEEYGRRVHSSTGRMPKEHFESVEQPCLLPAPTEAYDIPVWCEPKVGRDHFAQVQKALYTLPTRFIGQRLVARADRQTVRFYKDHQLVKAYPRRAPGEKAIDSNDFPKEATPYAMRDVTFLESEARKHGQAVGDFAKALLADPLPWTKMRRVRALLGLVKKYGEARVEQTCKAALAAEMVDLRRLTRMLEVALTPEPTAPVPPPLAKVIPLARYLRPPAQYALPLAFGKRDNEGEEK